VGRLLFYDTEFFDVGEPKPVAINAHVLMGDFFYNTPALRLNDTINIPFNEFTY